MLRHCSTDFPPRCALLGDVDTIAAQFEDRSGFTGAEFDPPVRDKIERRDAFSDASRMIVAWRHEHDAMAETYAFCALRARCQKHLRRGGMGIFLKEMVLDLPRVVDADAVGEFDLFERLAINSVLGISVPGPWNLVFIKDAEFHLSISPALHLWPFLMDDPSLMANAIEELLRYNSSVQVTGRTTLEDVDEIGGIRLEKGQSVVCLLGSANRDPAIYRDPDRLDVTRRDVRPLSFGGGIHYCVGAQLARMEGEIAIATLLRRLPKLRIDDIDHPDWRQTFVLRGLNKLPASW